MDPGGHRGLRAAAVAVLAFDQEFLRPEYAVTYAGCIISIVPLAIVFALTARRFMKGLEDSLGN
jgi:ABC-type glycerol-3-phosphate transport system permease component